MCPRAGTFSRAIDKLTLVSMDIALTSKNYLPSMLPWRDEIIMKLLAAELFCTAYHLQDQFQKIEIAHTHASIL
jgi:hypothetical protein